MKKKINKLELEVTVEIIQDNRISALLLCSLPQVYDTLIIALESRNEQLSTPTYIKSKLIDEFNRGYENEENSKYTVRAFKANRK